MQPLEQLTLPTDLYLPDLPESQKAPLVVISHGLGGDRTTFAYLAEHLASHGLAVAVVEHPGSSSAQLEALLTGLTNQGVESEEMIRRPVSIQTLLDELTVAARNPEIGSRVNLQQVGMLGQSLGGYTTLALAGATIDRSSLELVCPPEISSQANLSLLLQCSVLTLPPPLPPLQESRIQAAIAINPFDSVIFGPQGMANIAVPTMLMSSSNDTVTPALAEQLRPFSWLTPRDRYLLLMENGTHFSTIYRQQTGEDVIPVPRAVVGPAPEAAQRYVRAMSVAFFKVYLAADDAYRQYLDPVYVEALSQSELPAYLVQDLALED
jgi:predicted dienelactone hydrolase